MLSLSSLGAVPIRRQTDRAGRDGKKARCLLLHNGNAYRMNLDIIGAKDSRAVRAADEMYSLCLSGGDIHRQILQYRGKGAE